MRFCLLLLISTIAYAQQVSIDVSPAVVKACGSVQIDGSFTAPGLQSVPPTWSWGDGETTQSYFPAKHRYKQDGAYIVTVSILQGSVVLTSQRLTVTVSGASAPVCAELLVTDPVRMNLRDGQTSGTLIVSRVSPVGVRTVLTNDSVNFRSLSPSLISVTPAAVVSATGFGAGQIEIEDKSTSKIVLVDVNAGELQLSPPYLRLHLTASPQAQLQVSATRADGQPVNLAGRSIMFFDPNPPPPTPVVSVSSTGVVRALRVPATVNETPILHASLDGVVASNTTIVRVANAFPDSDFVELPFGRTVFDVARQVGSWNYEDILRRSMAAQWTNAALELEAEAAGYRTDRGGMHWLVNDLAGTADPNDPTVPCSISGNPTRLGASPAKPESSCVIVSGTDPIPQWFIFFHELGHDYAGQTARYNQWIENVHGPFNTAIAEGMATAFAQYAAQTMRQRRLQLAIPDSTLQEFERNALFPTSARWRTALGNYTAAGSPWARFDSDVFNGITATLMTEFGTEWFARFAGVLLPANARFDFLIENESQAATFIAAAMSAAAETDLRTRFRTWSFPIDDVYYNVIYGQLLQLTKVRTPIVSGNGIVNAASFKATGTPPAIAPGQWISVFGTSLAPRLVAGQILLSSLEGTVVEFIDRSGMVQPGQLQFVSPDHINALVPDTLVSGAAQVRIRTFSGLVTLPVSVESIQPGIFSAAASGQGPAAATWLQISRTDGQRTTGLTFDPSTRRSVPINLSAGETYISFFGSGFRGARAATVTALLGGVPVPVLGATAQGQFAGLDQLTVGPLPATLSGKGEIDLEATFEGQTANKVTIAVR